MATVVWLCCVIVLAFLYGFKAEVTKQRGFRPKRSFEISKLEFSRDDRECHDLCGYMSHLCRNAGTCVIDQRTCEGGCVCSPGWSGKWCKDRVPEDERSGGSTKSLPKQDSLSQFSNKSHNRTERVVGDGETNEKKSEGTFAAKIPILNKPTAIKENHVMDYTNSTTSRKNELEGRTKCQKTCQNGDCYNIYGEYRCKPRVNASDSSASRVCGPGFTCEHGICDMEALRNNSYDCICENNYVGQFCTHPCPLECGEHGFCDLHVADNTYKCFCQWNYTGLNCSELVPPDKDTFLDQEEVVFHWYVVGVSIVTVLLVLASTVAGAYFMWRKRLVFMLKIVHYFQHCEDDDGKEFDAFISYKSSPEDEAFVLHQLRPRLETQLNFKLCLHFRDFLPGEAIANNIVKAIESSRRTIMVLSPAYVKSEWCRMEYQKAQHEMLKLKHKIIPVVLEDVSDLTNLDKNLNTILNSVTYIEWPGHEDSKRLDKFWKKVELSMPKRSNSRPSCSGYSESWSDNCSQSTSVTPSAVEKVAIENSDKESVRSSSRKRVGSQRSKRKCLKHFMGRLVQSRLFNRQDSNSSQAALVDEETSASRSSCDSVSESVFTESSDSACSTPVTARTLLSDAEDNTDSQQLNNVFFSLASRSVSPSKENLLQLCEKDHCEGSNCATCAQNVHNYGLVSYEGGDERFFNRGFSADEDDLINSTCNYCKRSDYNRVRISALEGEKLKIQKVLVDSERCMVCRHPLNRQSPYRGSMKQHKDATNIELQKRARVNSLPRNYKRTAELARREVTLDIDSLVEDVGDSIGQIYIDVCEDV